MIKKMISLSVAVLAITAFANSTTHGKPSDYTGNLRNLSLTPAGKLKVSGNGVWNQKTLLDITKAKQVSIDFEFTQTSGTANGGIGIVCYDKNKNTILPIHFNRTVNSDTELAESCTFTDSKIIIKNGASWKKGGNYLAAFETAADFSDLPNRNITRNGIKEVKKLANGNYEVTFTNEIGKEYPAGTAVRQHAAGATYKYLHYGKIKDFQKNIKYSIKNLRPGTAYIGFIVLINNAKNFSTEVSFQCEAIK